MTQEHNTEARVRFGSLDWRHPEWEGSYYPEDLPPDWQLGYYANEQSAVLLPAAAWQQAERQQLEDWADELHDDFRIFLMLAPAADTAEQLQRAAAFGGRLGGLLWDGENAPAGAFARYPDELPAGVDAWADPAGIRVALLDLHGHDLRARRAVLEQLAPLLADGDVAIILAWEGVTPAEVRELQTVAELLGIA
jgi:hypothetical protein